MIAPRTAASVGELPWAPMAAAALGLYPLASFARLGGLAERGVVARDGDLFDTTVPHEERTDLAHIRHDSV